MSETDAEVVQEDQDLVAEPTEVEIEAASHGWTPEGVEGKRNLTAEEFMDRQPLYDELRSTKKQMKKIQEGMDALKVHHERVAANERAKIMAQLKTAKKDALENQDFDAVIEIDDKMAQENAASVADKAYPASNVVFEKWVEENDWYNQDPEMKEYADMIGNGYASQHTNKDIGEIYKFVSKEVKKRFSDKFQRSSTSSPVEATQRGRTSSRKLTARDLPEQDRQIMKSILRAGGITEEQYLKEYNELNS